MTGKSGTKRSVLRRSLLITISVVFGLLILEIAVRLTLARSTSMTIPDARLGVRPNPAYPGFDRNGFRNERVPSQADVVALGDSQTWGTAVAMEEAWPKQLGFKMHSAVYNISFGGYGPAQQSILYEEAVRFKPKIVLEAFYAGNDLYDSFSFIYKARKLPEFMSKNEALQKKIQQIEDSDPIIPRIQRLYFMISGLHDPNFFSSNLKFYPFLEQKFLERKRLRDEWKYSMELARDHPESMEIFEAGKFKTVFTTKYRLEGLRLTDPRISEGLRISLDAIYKMQQMALKDKIRFVVLLMPTKERVFRNLVKTERPDYRELMKMEDLMWMQSKSFLEENQIEYFDAFSALQGALKDGIQPYRASFDGHPNKFGHRAIAAHLHAFLENPN